MRGHRVELVSKLTDQERGAFLKTLTNPPRKSAYELAKGLVRVACLGGNVGGAYGKLVREERVFIGTTLGHRGVGAWLRDRMADPVVRL